MSNGIITAVAGNGGWYDDGGTTVATSASLKHPSAIAVASSGDIYITDLYNNKIRKVNCIICCVLIGDETYINV